MAANITQTFTIRLGYWARFELKSFADPPSETIGISDSIVSKVIVKMAEAIGVKDTSPARQTIQDVIVLIEGISAWVKGAIKTLFISDDRYFRKRG